MLISANWYKLVCGYRARLLAGCSCFWGIVRSVVCCLLSPHPRGRSLRTLAEVWFADPGPDTQEAEEKSFGHVTESHLCILCKVAFLHPNINRLKWPVTAATPTLITRTLRLFVCQNPGRIEKLRDPGTLG